MVPICGNNILNTCEAEKKEWGEMKNCKNEGFDGKVDLAGHEDRGST